MSRCSETKRSQLSRSEKEEVAKKIRFDSGREEILQIMTDWNFTHQKQIDSRQLERIRSQLPKFASPEQFWESVKEKVLSEVTKVGGDSPTGWEKLEGDSNRLDATKVPTMTEVQLETISFNFGKERYHRADAQGKYDASEKAFRNDFRNHLDAHGLVYGDFSDFITRDHKSSLDQGGDNWAPSCPTGPWPVVVTAICRDGVQIHKDLGGVISDDKEERDGRINPGIPYLLNRFEKHQDETAMAATKRVLQVGEGLYSSVARSLMLKIRERADSTRRTVDIEPNMHSSAMSLLSCLGNLKVQRKMVKTLVQLEHLDDDLAGYGGLWGLVNGQYVIVWLNSYEMNRELVAIFDFWDFVMSKKPENWSNEAFWNLVACSHLENTGFTGQRRPTPVKIPLVVGKLLLFDFMVMHAGMPFEPNTESMRGHIYWAQVSGRAGIEALSRTFWPWQNHTPFYPGWRFIADTRRQFL